MTLDLMDGLVHQELRVSLEFQAGQEEQDLMETLGIKVSLVPEGILGMMEIGEIQGLWDIQVFQGDKDFLVPRVIQDHLMDNQVHLDPEASQERMASVHLEGYQETQVIWDPEETQDDQDHQAFQENEEYKEDQVPLDPVVHKAIQVFQVFPVIKEVWDYQAPLADMGPQGPLDHQV